MTGSACGSCPRTSLMHSLCAGRARGAKEGVALRAAGGTGSASFYPSGSSHFYPSGRSPCPDPMTNCCRGAKAGWGLWVTEGGSTGLHPHTRQSLQAPQNCGARPSAKVRGESIPSPTTLRVRLTPKAMPEAWDPPQLGTTSAADHPPAGPWNTASPGLQEALHPRGAHPQPPGGFAHPHCLPDRSPQCFASTST